MDARGYQQYKQQSINSMTPGELLLMLYDELVKRSTLASMALEKENWPQFEEAMDRCIDIVNYLDETLDRKYPISRDLGGLTFTDSSGIAVLLRAHRRMGQVQGAMRVVRTPDQAGKVFQAAGLERIIRFE